MPRVIHFEIYADEPEHAIKFYKTVFGWQVQKYPGPMDYWLLNIGKEVPGINGAIMRREKHLTGSGDIVTYVCTVGIDSIDKYSIKIQEAGGKIIVPKSPISGLVWFA
jgi:predicted enzyme related to lactoylglutathione lyase